MKIIDNKKIDLTDDEWNMYEKIVKSYTSIHCRGEDLFSNLFHTDENGIIVFLIPPSKKHTSLEVFLFLTAIMTQQHLRLVNEQVADICKQMKDKMHELDEKLALLNKKE